MIPLGLAFRKLLSGAHMVTLELEPEVDISEPSFRLEFTACYECHRLFPTKGEGQFRLELCDVCIDAMRHLGETVISTQSKVRPQSWIAP